MRGGNWDVNGLPTSKEKRNTEWGTLINRIIRACRKLYILQDFFFFDGYCSTVQGLLDWFEVDLGGTLINRSIRACRKLCILQDSSIQWQVLSSLNTDYIFMYIYICTYVYIYICVYMYIYIHIHTCICVHIYVYIHVHVYI